MNLIQQMLNCKISPKTIKEALNSEYAKEWAAAMKEEMDNLKLHNTFNFVDRPKFCYELGTT